jgi:hypothetical protein
VRVIVELGTNANLLTHTVENTDRRAREGAKTYTQARMNMEANVNANAETKMRMKVNVVVTYMEVRTNPEARTTMQAMSVTMRRRVVKKARVEVVVVNKKKKMYNNARSRCPSCMDR